MSVLKHSGADKECTLHPRAEQETAQLSTDCTNCRAEQRTDQSLRAEKAFRDWSKEPEIDRPLVKHRAAHVRALAEWMDEHGVSKCRLADLLGVNEKQVRKMLKGEVTIPGEVSSCIPKSLRQDYLDRLAEIDGGCAPGIDSAISRLDKAGLLDALTRITAALGKR